MQADTLSESIWPVEQNTLSPKELDLINNKIESAVTTGLNQMQVAGLPENAIRSLYIPLANWVSEHKPADKPLVLGINGAQGSGKSTLCELLRLILTAGFDYKVVGFSVDDIYHTRATRQQLANDIHPLLQTRGVPGTHEVELGIKIIQQLLQADDNSRTAIPAFDKACDDRRPEDQWLVFEGQPDIIIFEGWCVGCKPQPETELQAALNQLEQDEDNDGSWRRYVNNQLLGPYQELYNLLDLLVMLRIPSMECVFEWRSLQESKLAAQTKSNASHVMDEAALHRFIMHYERLTRYCLEEMPDRADATLFLNLQHQVERVKLLA